MGFWGRSLFGGRLEQSASGLQFSVHAIVIGTIRYWYAKHLANIGGRLVVFSILVITDWVASTGELRPTHGGRFGFPPSSQLGLPEVVLTFSDAMCYSWDAY